MDHRGLIAHKKTGPGYKELEAETDISADAPVAISCIREIAESSMQI